MIVRAKISTMFRVLSSDDDKASAGAAKLARSRQREVQRELGLKR